MTPRCSGVQTQIGRQTSINGTEYYLLHSPRCSCPAWRLFPALPNSTQKPSCSSCSIRSTGARSLRVAISRQSCSDIPQSPVSTALTKWLAGNHFSRPHFHPNDRFITVLSGTWWVGSGPDFDPNASVPMPAGAFVTHYGKQVHWDGAKDTDAVLLIVGEGPATITPFVPATPTGR